MIYYLVLETLKHFKVLAIETYNQLGEGHLSEGCRAKVYVISER